VSHYRGDWACAAPGRGEGRGGGGWCAARARERSAGVRRRRGVLRRLRADRVPCGAAVSAAVTR